MYGKQRARMMLGLDVTRDGLPVRHEPLVHAKYELFLVFASAPKDPKSELLVLALARGSAVGGLACLG